MQPDQLQNALAQIAALDIPRESKAVLSDILKAASNEDADSVDVIINTLPEGRKRNVQKTARRVATVTKGVTDRAGAALREMSDEAWDRLVNDDGD